MSWKSAFSLEETVGTEFNSLIQLVERGGHCLETYYPCPGPASNPAWRADNNTISGIREDI